MDSDEIRAFIEANKINNYCICGECFGIRVQQEIKYKNLLTQKELLQIIERIKLEIAESKI